MFCCCRLDDGEAGGAEAAVDDRVDMVLVLVLVLYPEACEEAVDWREAKAGRVGAPYCCCDMLDMLSLQGVLLSRSGRN